MENIKVWKKINYKNNKLDGEYITYHKNGNILNIKNYTNGKQYGEFKSFHKDGTIW